MVLYTLSIGISGATTKWVQQYLAAVAPLTPLHTRSNLPILSSLDEN